METGIESLTIAVKGERRPALGYCAIKSTVFYTVLLCTWPSAAAFLNFDDHDHATYDDIGYSPMMQMRDDALG